MTAPVMTHKTDDQNQTSEPNFDCDVLVVGAGPAGATAAYYIALAKKSVILLDKEHFPRQKICGEFVSPGSIRELKKMGITNLPTFKDNIRINQAVIYLNGKEMNSGKFPLVSDMPQYGQVMHRTLLDSLILEVARNAGVRALEGFKVTGFKVENRGVTVTANGAKGSRTFRTRLLIGADGNDSAIANLMRGGPVPKENQAVVARGYFENVAGLPNEAGIFYGNDSFPGFSWIFPIKTNEANVGVGTILDVSPKAEQPKTLITKLINNDAGMRSRLEHATLKGEISESTLNLYDPKFAIVGNRVMLVGEAAGLINPFNGEGIQFALLSGRWASEVVATASSSDFSEQALSAYSKRVEDELADGFRVSVLMLQLIRNRNLNPLWLKALEIMGDRSKKDPEYARLTSGILSGMIFPNQEIANKIVNGVLQEAAVSTGTTVFTDMLSNPSKAPQVVFRITETGIEVAKSAAQNPLSALTWGMSTATKMVEMAATISKQVIKDAEKGKETP